MKANLFLLCTVFFAVNLFGKNKENPRKTVNLYEDRYEVYSNLLDESFKMWNDKGFLYYFNDEVVELSRKDKLEQNEIDLLVDYFEEGVIKMCAESVKFYNAFEEYKKLELTTEEKEEYLQKYYKKNMGITVDCIPNPQACAVSLGIYSNCSFSCPGCCLALIGVRTHCCNIEGLEPQ